MQLENFDISDLIKNGDHFLGLRHNDPVEKLLSTLGSPLVKTGNDNAGYYEYSNGLRFGYFDGTIDEIALLFYYRNNIHYKYELRSNQTTEFITNESKINQLIKILNIEGVEWECWNKSDSDFFCLRTKTNCFITFDLENGKLWMISFPKL